MNTNVNPLQATLAALPGLAPEERSRAIKILSSLASDREREAFVAEVVPIAMKLERFRGAADHALRQMNILVREAEQTLKKSDRSRRERSATKRERKRLKKLQSSIEKT